MNVTITDVSKVCPRNVQERNTDRTVMELTAYLSQDNILRKGYMYVMQLGKIKPPFSSTMYKLIKYHLVMNKNKVRHQGKILFCSLLHHTQFEPLILLSSSFPHSNIASRNCRQWQNRLL